MPLAVTPPAEVIEVSAGWFVGAYRFSQTPAEDSGPLYPSDLSFGYDGSPALTRGLAIDARAWLGQRIGLELSAHGASYTERFANEGQTPNPEARTLEQATLAVLARRCLPLRRLTLTSEVQLGLWTGSIMVHGQAADEDGSVAPEVRQAMMGGGFGGAGATVAAGGWQLRATERLGLASDLSPAWVNAGLDLRRDLTHGLYASLDLQGSSRIATLSAPDAGSVGTVADRLGGATLALGYAR